MAVNQRVAAYTEIPSPFLQIQQLYKTGDEVFSLGLNIHEERECYCQSIHWFEHLLKGPVVSSLHVCGCKIGLHR